MLGGCCSITCTPKSHLLEGSRTEWLNFWIPCTTVWFPLWAWQTMCAVEFTSSFLVFTIRWIQLEVLYFSASVTVNNDSWMCCRPYCVFSLNFGEIQQSKGVRECNWLCLMGNTTAYFYMSCTHTHTHTHQPTCSLFSGRQGWFQASLSLGTGSLTSAEPESTNYSDWEETQDSMKLYWVK